MPFRYSLQTILRLRSSLEHQEEQRLMAKAAIVARLRFEIQRLQTNHLENKRAAQKDLLHGSSAVILEFLNACDVAYAETLKSLRHQLEEADRQRLVQLRIYWQVRQGREILEGLRDHQEAAYDLNVARQEQQRADETFLIRSFLNTDE